jgi:hypothetical protein
MAGTEVIHPRNLDAQELRRFALAMGYENVEPASEIASRYCVQRGYVDVPATGKPKLVFAIRGKAMTSWDRPMNVKPTLLKLIDEDGNTRFRKLLPLQV